VRRWNLETYLGFAVFLMIAIPLVVLKLKHLVSILRTQKFGLLQLLLLPVVVVILLLAKQLGHNLANWILQK
jgi:hypothetical protein